MSRHMRPRSRCPWGLSKNTRALSLLPPIACPRPNAEAIDSAVKSRLFWATVRAVNELALQCEFAGRWAEGCPCHQTALTSFATEQAGIGAG